MSDDLRTRIAKALSFDSQSEEVQAAWLPHADAVIAELGLTRQTRSERVPKHRYVTEWETDNEAAWYLEREIERRSQL